jgi:hypothetical protein
VDRAGDPRFYGILDLLGIVGAILSVVFVSASSNAFLTLGHL